MSRLVEKSIIVIIISVIFYSLILFLNDFKTLMSGFQHVRLEFLPIVLLFSFGLQLLSGIRYHVLITKLGVKSSFKESILISLAGQSMIATPGRIGSLIKSYLIHKKFGNSHSSTMPSIFIEQLMELITATALLSILLIWFDVLETKIIIIISTCLIVLFIFMMINPYFFKVIKKLFKIKFFQTFLKSFEEANNSFLQLLSLKILSKGLLLSTGIKLGQVLMIFIVLHMVGLNISLFESALIYNTSLLIGVFSFIPGGIVVTDASLLSLILEFDDNLIFASIGVISIRFISLWFNILIGFIVLKSKFGFKTIKQS